MAWTPKEEDKVVELFLDYDFKKSFKPIIKLQLSKCPVLKGKNVQQVYDKILQLRKRQATPKVVAVEKVTFAPNDTLFLTRLFDREIKGSGSITEENVRKAVMTTLVGREMLEQRHTAEKLAAKVRYHRAKWRKHGKK